MMRQVLLRTSWWAMAALSCVGAVFAWPMNAEAQNPFLLVPLASSAIVGAVLAHRRPENPVGWVFLGVGAAAGILIAAVVLTTWGAGTAGAVTWWGVAAAWVGSWVWYPLVYLLTTPTLLLFPSGLLSPRWRIALWLPLVGLLGIIVLAAGVPFLSVEFDDSGNVLRQVDNPLSPGFMSGVDKPEESALFQFFTLFFVGGVVAAIVSAGIRIKRARGIERLQMRWFGFAVAMFVPLIALEIRFGDDGLLWMNVVEAAVLAAVPISCGIAILRYRLYDIDRIISRTTSYAIVTGVLLAGYAVVVTTVSGLLPESGSLAVASATLVVAAAFRPLLRRVRMIVDRRFDRAHYDAELATAEFAHRLREQTDPDAVAAELVELVRRSLEPAGTALWLRGGPR